jgi:Fe-S cluster assembly protein SufD
MSKGLPADVRDKLAAGFLRSLTERAPDPEWMSSGRRAAFDVFVTEGWPTTKQEEWRFTDPSPMAAAALLHDPSPVAPSSVPPAYDPSLAKLGADLGTRLLFLDGRYRPELSSPRGNESSELTTVLSTGQPNGDPAWARLLGQQLHHQNAFVALNTAFMRDGVLVRIPEGSKHEAPIVLVFLSSVKSPTSLPRVVISAGPGSQATVVEVHAGPAEAATLTNAATEIVVEANAALTYHTVQSTSPAGFHVHHVAVEQKRDSSFHSHNLSLGGRLVRNDLRVALSERGASCTLDGLYLSADTSHVDNHTSIEHRASHTTSREDYRGVVDGKSRAVFSGRIVVHADAQQTDARQNNRNILLSEGARVHTKPHLEIFANDVKCSHGATTGRLDEEALFYLRSRGIGAKEANQLLVRAFLFAGLDRIAGAPLRQGLETVLARRIDSLGTRLGVEAA